MEGDFESFRIPICGHHATVRRFSPPGGAPEWSIVALHGFTGSGADFSALRGAMAGLPLEWLCPDFMGHGDSDSPDNVDPYRLPATLSLIDQTRCLARNPANVLLLAYSMGGRIALHYLKRARPLHAVLIGASPGIEDPAERAQRRERDTALIRVASGDIQAFCETWERQDLIQPQTRLPEPLRSQLARRRRLNTLHGLANSLAGCGSGALPSLWNELGHLPGLTCVFGENDGKFAQLAQRMQRENPRIQAHAVETSGHAPHLENPEAVAAVLKNHLNIG